jgi:hypothetical protein
VRLDATARAAAVALLVPVQLGEAGVRVASFWSFAPGSKWIHHQFAARSSSG